jgi:hypothetical protein
MIHSLIICFFLVATMAFAQIDLSLKVHCRSYSILKQMRKLSQKELAPKALGLNRTACPTSRLFINIGGNRGNQRKQLQKPRWWN